MKRFRAVLISLALLLAVALVFVLGFSAPAPTGAAPAVVSMSIQPASPVVFPGQVFTVSLSLAGVSDAGGYEATIFYDPSLLQLQAVTHPTPRFLAVNGRTAAAPLGDPLINAALGRLTTAEYSYAVGNPTGASGSGVLAKFRFKALAVGISPLTFSSETLYPVLLRDSDDVSINFTAIPGQVNIVQPINVFLPLVRR